MRSGRRTWPWWAAALLLVPLVWYSALALSIYLYADEYDASPSDAAIVLGAAVWDDQPSPVFRERINHGVWLYQQGIVETLIFTGGIGPGKSFSEAAVARDYAIAAGVPAEDILVEEVSTVTEENLIQAKQIIAARGIGRVLIVSDPLHMRRAIVIARQQGLEAYPSPTPTSMFRSWRTRALFIVDEAYYLWGQQLRTAGRYYTH
ncbi:MAG: YdcF family protein [Alcanivorax sp.]|nr:YdcF family protein [Alcanivorax sp.]